MAKRRKMDESNGESATLVEIDEERLKLAKQTEEELESARLAFEEAKAKYVMARAEYNLQVVRRNIAIARSNDPTYVEDAQRLVDNAKSQMKRVKAARDGAKDDWKGTEERLAKVLTEKLPLFD